MRKFKKSLLVLLVGGLLFVHVPSSYAVFSIFGSGGLPVFDPLNVAGEGAGVVMTTLGNITTAQATVNDKINNLKKSIASKLSSLFAGKRKNKKIAGGKKIKPSQLVDLSDPSAIKPQVYKLFWTYPSTDSTEQAAYRSKTQEFYEDTMLETYTAVRGLEAEFNELKPQIESSIQQLEDGADCSDSSQGSNTNCEWSQLYKANQTYESILVIIEELSAIKAQMVAARGIKDSVQPVVPVATKKPGKRSSLESNKFLFAQVSYSETIGFAQENFASSLSSQPFQGRQVFSKSVAQADDSAKLVKAEGGVNPQPLLIEKTLTSEPMAPDAAPQGFDESDEKHINQVINSQKNYDNKIEKINSATFSEEDEKAISEQFAAIEAKRISNVDMGDALLGAPANKDVSVEGVFKFVTPPTPKFDIPYLYAKDKVAELSKIEPIYLDVAKALEYHNTMQSLPYYRDIFKRYDQLSRLHAKSYEALQQSDKCGISLLSRYYKDPIILWSARDLSKQANLHNIRGGLSGWAYNAYELAKAESGNPASLEDVADFDLAKSGSGSPITADNLSDAMVKEFDTMDYKLRAEQEKSMKDSLGSKQFFKDDSQQAKIAQESRKIANISWNIGAQAIKSLDLEPQKWNATMTNKFPVWEDQRRFYNEYLDKKYANIIKYIQSINYGNVVQKFIDALVADKSKYDDIETTRINQEFSAKKDSINTIADAEIKVINSKLSADKSSALHLRNSDITSYEKDRNVKIHLYNIEEASQRQKWSDANAIIDRNNSQHSSNMVLLSGFEQELAEIPGKLAVPGLDQSERLRLENRSSTLPGIIQGIKSELSNLSASNSEQALLKEAAQNEIATINNNIVVVKNDCAAKSAAEEALYNSKCAELDGEATQLIAGVNVKRDGEIVVARQAAEAEIERHKEYSENRKDGTDTPVEYVSDLTRMVKQKIETLKFGDMGIKLIVNNARQKIRDLGDDAFRAEEYGKVRAIHQEMLDQLMAYQVAVQTIRSDDVILLSLNVVKDALQESGGLPSGQPDSDYFIGTSPFKAREMSFPKPAVATSFLNMREIVFFDDVDWSNATPLSRDSFLKYGAEIPEIWKYMLKDKAFVETDFDLNKALQAHEGDDPELAFIRAGRYPCMVGSFVVDLNKEYNYSLHSKRDKTYGNCVMETVENATVINSKYGTSIKTVIVDGPAKDAYSELSVLLKNDKEFTTFANELFAILQEKKKNPLEGGEESFENYVKRLMPFTVNQVGSFLVVSETEMDMRKTKEDVGKQVEEAKWGKTDEKTGKKISDGLYDRLKALGFEPSADFNLANPEDYNLAFTKLRSVKQEFINNADVGLIGVDTFDNEVAEERVTKYKGLVRGLRQDSEAVLMLGESVESEAKIAEDIKAETVNRTANAEYQERADKAIEDSIKNFAKPYCAVY